MTLHWHSLSSLRHSIHTAPFIRGNTAQLKMYNNPQKRPLFRKLPAVHITRTPGRRPKHASIQSKDNQQRRNDASDTLSSDQARRQGVAPDLPARWVPSLPIVRNVSADNHREWIVRLRDDETQAAAEGCRNCISGALWARNPDCDLSHMALQFGTHA